MTLFTTLQSPKAPNPCACAQKNDGKDLGPGRPEPGSREALHKAVFKSRRFARTRGDFLEVKERKCDTVAQKSTGAIRRQTRPGLKRSPP